MRRALRHLFTILSALSLLLCVGTCVLWVRSYTRFEQLAYTSRYDDKLARSEISIDSAAGTIRFARIGTQYLRADVPRPRFAGFEVASRPLAEYADSHADLEGEGFWGFALTGEQTASRPTLIQHALFVLIPHWFLALLTIAIPLHWTVTTLRKRIRGSAGRCLTCGYDLRASPERCPECGTEVKPQPAEGATA
jgi:hypothetical protein